MAAHMLPPVWSQRFLCCVILAHIPSVAAHAIHALQRGRGVHDAFRGMMGPALTYDTTEVAGMDFLGSPSGEHERSRP